MGRKVKKDGRTVGKSFFFLYICAVSVWTELVIKADVYGFAALFDRGALMTLIFSLSFGVFAALISTLFGPRLNKAAAIVLLSLEFVSVNFYRVYFEIFAVYPSLGSAGGAGAIVQFIDITLKAIFDCRLPILLTLIPILPLYFCRALHIDTGRIRAPQRIAGAAAAVALFLAGSGAAWLSTGGSPSPRQVYYDEFVSLLSVRNFGVMTSVRLEAQSMIFGDRGIEKRPEGLSDAYKSYSAEGYNVMEVDFGELAEDEDNADVLWLHEVFSAKEPTEKNAYTGMFRGKNLVFITAESFSPYAIDPEITPLLYKMANGGFRFTNYYSPLWGVSTTDGEYANCQGLIPKSGTWSFARSSENYLPFALGNQLSAQGYSCFAYHDHQFDFYHRDRSHPNMGYVYKGVGKGLEMTDTWPESDAEMFEKTVGEYIDGAPFHAYYMSVSGHMNYNFTHNGMAAKNRDAVAGLDCSEEGKAYIAANLELEYGLGILMEELEARGIADDTVIVMTADHYPYALGLDTMDELAGEQVERRWGIYKSTLIIYCPGMETVQVDKLCSSVDILPTLSNLFGLEYDSRMMSGSDVFSDSEPLVIFGNHSWLTEKGFYDTYTDRFTPFGDVTEEGYVGRMCEETALRFEVAAAILENDYYRAVFGR